MKFSEELPIVATALYTVSSSAVAILCANDVDPSIIWLVAATPVLINCILFFISFGKRKYNSHVSRFEKNAKLHTNQIQQEMQTDPIIQNDKPINYEKFNTAVKKIITKCEEFIKLCDSIAMTSSYLFDDEEEELSKSVKKHKEFVKQIKTYLEDMITTIPSSEYAANPEKRKRSITLIAEKMITPVDQKKAGYSISAT